MLFEDRVLDCFIFFIRCYFDHSFFPVPILVETTTLWRKGKESGKHFLDICGAELYPFDFERELELK